MKTARVILISGVILTATLSIAGTAWRYKCDAPNCGLEGRFGMGGGFIFEEVSGFCTTCKKFVSISWKRQGLTGERKKIQDKATDLLETAPPKIGNVWNPAVDRAADLYPCPHCKKPFMEIDEMDLLLSDHALDKRFCPSCTNLTLKLEHTGIHYD